MCQEVVINLKLTSEKGHREIDWNRHQLVVTAVMWIDQLIGSLAFLSGDWSSGGLGGTIGKRSASTSALTSSLTWSLTAAESPHPKWCPAPVPAALAPLAHHAPSISSTTFLLWWCIMGRVLVQATTPPTATTQKAVSEEGLKTIVVVETGLSGGLSGRPAAVFCLSRPRKRNILETLW